MTARQRVLVLYLANSALDSPVVGWSMWDGSSDDPVPPVDAKPQPPYPTGLDALRDGWRLIQMTPLTAPAAGTEREVNYLRHEFVFEQLVDVED